MKARGAHGAPAELPAPLIAFEIDALLAGANIAGNLLDDPDALNAVRRILGIRLGLTNIDSG